MNPKIIFQEIICDSKNIKEQKLAVRSLLFNLTGKRIKHSKTGRPIIDESMDISISHKNDLICVGIVSNPYRIGVDVEHLKNDINMRLFLKSVITKEEISFLKTFCKKSKISISSGIAIFWSIKEAFFKCLDYDLKPGKISVVDIRQNNEVKISCSEEIKRLMRERKLKLCSAKTVFNEKHIYSQAVMRKSASRELCTE